MQHPLGSHAADLAELRLVQALLAKAESRLAEAIALITELRQHIDQDRRPGSLFRRSGAFLANQPSAPKYKCFRCGFTTNDGRDVEEWQCPCCGGCVISNQPAAPSRFQGWPPFDQPSTAAQSASELMARVHAPLPGWDNIERRTAAPCHDYSPHCAKCRANVAAAQTDAPPENERLRAPTPIRKAYSFRIRFDGPPGPESGRFVECETLDGKGVNVGHWEQDGDDWLLIVQGYDPPAAPAYATAAQSASELMARVHATLPGWDSIERRTAAPTIGERCSSCDQRLDAESDRDTYHHALSVKPTGAEDEPTARSMLALAARTLDDHYPQTASKLWEYLEASQAGTEAKLDAQLESAIAAVKSYREVVARTEAEQAVLERVKRIVADTTIVHDRELRLTLCQELHVALDDRYGYHAKAQADRAVLDAMALVPEDTLRRSVSSTLHDSIHGRDPARAELARRERK